MKFLRVDKDECIALLIVFCATAVRFLIGLQSPHSIAIAADYVPSDLGVIALMSKHVLETGEFPFFFWGQNWFGGLEAFLHGVSFLFFGVSPWSMRITTLFLFALFCLLTFLIARRLFNGKVALLSLVWCVVAPMKLTELSLVPQTHYLETFVLGSLILWMTIVLCETSGPIRQRILYFALGLMSGISWWVSPMIVYYLLPVAAFIVLRKRFEAVKKGVIFSLPGFILGAFPFLFYYFSDPYSSFAGMSGGFGLQRIPFGFKQYILKALPAILDVFNYKFFNVWASWGLGLFYLWVFAYFILKAEGKSFIRLLFFKESQKGCGGILFLLFLSVTLIYSASEHATRAAPHYVIAIFSFVPIAFGYTLWSLSRKWKWLAVSVLAAYFLTQGTLMAQWALYDVPYYEDRARAHMAIINFIKSKGLDRAYGNFYMGSTEITFLAAESIICAGPMEERYEPYELLMDQAKDPAYIDEKYRRFVPILKITGGACKEKRISGYSIYYDFAEPDRRYKQINSQTIKASASVRLDLIDHVLDRDKETLWSTVEPRTKNMWVSFDLGRVYSLGMVRFFNPGDCHREYAQIVSLEVSQDDQEWQEVLEKTPGDYFYWSGPRFYPWEWNYRMEIRFGPVQARYIRIKQYETSRLDRWNIYEAFIYEDVGSGSLGGKGTEEMLERIHVLGLDQIYADRWMSAKVREKFGDHVKTIHPFSWAIGVFFNRVGSRIVEWTAKTGFILENSDADEFENKMKEEGIRLVREHFDRWELFYFDLWTPKERELEEDRGWYWMGLGVIKTNKKERSEYLRKAADRRAGEGAFAEAQKYYEKSLKDYLNNQIARKSLIGLLKKTGESEKAKSHQRILDEQTIPKNPCRIEFERGVLFLGYTLETNRARPGQKVKISYYWTLLDNPGRGIGVFVHINQGEHLIQGDHIFLQRYLRVWPALEGEIFSQEEFITVPNDAALGEYKIGLGLFDLRSGKRFEVRKTSLENQNNKVVIGSLQVIQNE